MGIENLKPVNASPDEEKVDTGRRSFLRMFGKAAVAAAVVGLTGMPEEAEAAMSSENFKALLDKVRATESQKKVILKIYNETETDIEKQMYVQQLKCNGGGSPEVVDLKVGDGTMSIKTVCR